MMHSFFYSSSSFVHPTTTVHVHRLLLFVLLLGGVSLPSSSTTNSRMMMMVEGGIIDPIPLPGETIHATATIWAPWWSDWDATPSVHIDSPISVSVLRYFDNQYLSGQAPISETEIRIVVKTSGTGCSNDLIDSIVTNITARNTQDTSSEYSSNEIEISLEYNANETTTTSTTPPNSSSSTIINTTEFPDSVTSFRAMWSYTSFWCGDLDANKTCPPTQAPEPSPTEPPSSETSSPEPSSSRGPSPGPSSQETSSPGPSVSVPETSSPGPTDDANVTEEETLRQANTAGASDAASSAAARSTMYNNNGGRRSSSRPSNLLTLLAMFWGSLLLVTYSNSPNLMMMTGRSFLTLCTLGMILSAWIVTGLDNTTTTNTTSPTTISPTTISPTTSPTTSPTGEGTCRIGVEILYDGCSQQLSITAPNVRVVDVIINNVSTKCDPSNPCTDLYEAQLDFPNPIYNVSFASQVDDVGDGREQVVINSLGRTKDFPYFCGRAVEGRPFVDGTGQSLQADPTIVLHHHHQSSNSMTSTSSTHSKVNDDTTTTTTTTTTANTEKEESLWSSVSSSSSSTFSSSDVSPSDELQQLADDWTRRALAEHASIASFAAFTIALMTNQAPPDLIQDSLSAAMDEVGHAKVSFEIASLLRNVMGQEGVVEPGPLPPSGHTFEDNLSSLVIGTATEGCIDETLSALVAAAEADYYHQQQQDEDPNNLVDPKSEEMMKLAPLLHEKMTRIAMEEGRHSILAWKTVHWACLKDDDDTSENDNDADDNACMAASKVLEETYLSRAAMMRFSGTQWNGEELEKAWTRIYQTLVPLVTTSTTTTTSGNESPSVQLLGTLLDGRDCQNQSYETYWNENETKTTIARLADGIIHTVSCSIMQRVTSKQIDASSALL